MNGDRGISSKNQEFMEGFCHHLTLMVSAGVARKRQIPPNPSIEQLEATKREVFYIVQPWVNECFRGGLSEDTCLSVSYLTAK